VVLKLQTRQSQQAIMTPALLQSLHCLQLPWEELKQELQHLWETNPCIELVMPKNDREFVIPGAESSREGDRWEERLVSRESLEDYLVNQIPELDAAGKEIFFFLVSHLDERGYLKISTETLSQQSPWSIKALESTRRVLCSLEPKGIGACDVVECWLAQIPEEQTSLRQFLIRNKNDLLAKRYSRIVKRMHWNRQQLAQILGYLRGLAASPLKSWQENDQQVRIPDLYFYLDAMKHWNVHLASESYALIWSDAYKEWLVNSRRDKGKNISADFRSQRMIAKRWMRSLSLRTTTMHRIGQFILDKQRLFFVREEHPLMSLLQKDAAVELQINPATLSRALQGKYASVPWGLVSLGDFFPRAWAKDNVKVSIPQIRQKISEWMAEEDKDHPLSDEDLARKLRSEMHWAIPRRTLEKYSRQWGIASSRDRKYGL
jgi:RNA polymerase sigma-54 factor